MAYSLATINVMKVAGLWFGAALLLCFMRGVRAARLRIDEKYADRHPARLETI